MRKEVKNPEGEKHWKTTHSQARKNMEKLHVLFYERTQRDDNVTILCELCASAPAAQVTFRMQLQRRSLSASAEPNIEAIALLAEASKHRRFWSRLDARLGQNDPNTRVKDSEDEDSEDSEDAAVASTLPT